MRTKMKLLFLGVLLSCAQMVFSQAAGVMTPTANGTPWNGVNVSSFNNTNFLFKNGVQHGQPNNLNTLYLVNVAAFKEYATNGNVRFFLNQAGFWGTEASLYEVGLPVYLNYQKQYKTWGAEVEILFSPVVSPTLINRLGHVRSYKDTRHQPGHYDWRGVFVDKKDPAHEAAHNVFTKWVLRTGSNLGATNNQYYICYENAGIYYLGYHGETESTTSPRKYILDATTTAGNAYRDDKYRWVLITRQDLINTFLKTPADYDHLADATFYIHDQNFSRRNASRAKWQRTANGKIGNAKNEATEINERYTVTAADRNYTTVEPGGKILYNNAFGAFFNAEIYGGKGKIMQTTLPVDRTGYYMLTCQGFYRPGDNSRVQNAYLFAKVTGTNQAIYSEQFGKTTLPIISAIDKRIVTDLTASGIKFYQGPETYVTKVIVYVEQGQTLDIGVEVEGTSTNASLDWAAFDNMKLKYLGGEFPVSEDFEDKNYYTKYGDQTLQTMVLHRKFIEGEWNSLVLPVDLNKDQVHTAFGNDVQIAELSGLDNRGYNIAFKSINFEAKKLKDVVIEKNKPYLIKPTRPSRIMKRDWRKIPIERTPGYFVSEGNHYIIPAVSMKVNEINPTSPSFTYGNGQKIMVKPNLYHAYDRGRTYKKIPGSESNYLYVMNKGYLTRYQRPFALKGTRWYLEYSQNPTNAKVAIEEGEEESYTTDIRPLGEYETTVKSQRKGVFNLKGQKVGNDTENLPSGIYIVDGKKVVVY